MAPSLTFWQQMSGESSVTTRPMSQFDMTVNVVCSKCNAGWLNDLEDRALAALEYFGLGKGRVPGRPELDNFAFWAIARALLRTHASPAGRAPQYLFHAIYEARDRRRLPNGCIVSIAPTAPVSMEAGLHQSVNLDGHYFGHVAVSFGTLFMSVLLGGPDQTTTLLVRRAYNQMLAWFPKTLWELAPVFRTPPSGLHVFRPAEAMVAGSSLGFFLDLAPCDQFGNLLDLKAVIPTARRGIVSWTDISRRK